jgi:hypothetical protein
MGICNGSKVLFSGSDLNLDHVKEMAKNMALVNGEKMDAVYRIVA